MGSLRYLLIIVASAVFLSGSGQSAPLLERGAAITDPQTLRELDRGPFGLARMLREHPAVQEACVVGLPDQRLGAVPVAAVELREGAGAVSEAELTQFLRDKVVAYQVPTCLRIVRALDASRSCVSSRAKRGMTATRSSLATATAP